MALHTVNVTLSGNTQVTTTRTPVKQVLIFNVAGNAAVLVGDRNLSATVYGFSIAAGAVGSSLGPFPGEFTFNLDEVYLRGTDTQVVRVLYIV